MKQTNFNADIANTNDFNSFEYKTELLGNTESDGADGILKHAKLAVSLNIWLIFGGHSKSYWLIVKLVLN